MKKTISFFLALAFAFVCFIGFGKVNAHAEATTEKVCYLQQQESGTGDDAKIRYVSTIIGVPADQIRGIDVELELSGADGTNAMVAKADLHNVYEAVTNATKEQDDTLYAVYTLKGVGASEYVGKVIKAKFVYHTADGKLTTNEVSHQIGATVTVDTAYTAQGTNSSAGNGQYITHNLKTIYAMDDDSISLDGLTVKVNGTKQDLSSAAVSVSEMSETIRPVTVTIGNETVVYVTYRAAVSDLTTNTTTKTYEVDVAKNYSQIAGTKDSNNNIVFSTLNQALDFYRANSSALDSSYTFKINVKPGTYNEKLELNIANLYLSGTNATGCIVQYDALYGIEDASGFTHVTDSTATVAVRANNIQIDKLTIQNKYCTIASYASTKYAGNGERALALLVQADQFVTKYSIYNGWQDTIELFTGRQYFFNCSVSGCIDYIFGTNNTTIFDRCSIITVKGKTSASSSGTNAYVTAFKGMNKSASDAPNYGTVFNDCSFTSESDFVGFVALVRPWTAYSNVAVINSSIDDTYQTDENKTIATGLISDVNVSTLNVKFYGITKNSSAVTITDNLSNVDTSLTAEEAANYTDFTKVYAKKNGGVTYSVFWDPVNGVATDPNTYYCFNGTEEATGTSYVFGDGSVSKTVTKGDMTLDATSGSIAYNSNSNTYNFKKGARITIANVPAGANVIVYAYSAQYAKFTIDGYAPTTDTMTYYNETKGTVTIVSTGDTYIGKVVVEPNAEAPVEKTVQSITVSNTPANDYAVNTDYDLSDIVVTAIYSDNTKKVVTDYTTNAATVIDKTSAGTYEVTVTYNGKTAKFNVKYVATVSDVIDTDTVLDFASSDGYTSVMNNTKVTKSSNYSGYNNGGNSRISAGTISFKVKSGTVITVKTYNWSSKSGGLVSFKGYFEGGSEEAVNNTSNDKYTFTAASDTTFYYEATDGNNYIEKIEIVCPSASSVISSNTTFVLGTSNTALKEAIDAVDGDDSSTTLQGKSVEVNGFTVDATASGAKLYVQNTDWSQFNTGTKITFTVATGATVTVIGYAVGNTALSVNGTANASDSDRVTITTTEETEVVVLATNNKYIRSIEITFE